MGGTFHSLARGQLRRWWADRGAPEPALLARKGRLIAELVSGRPGLEDVSIADLAGQVEWAKARLVAPASFAAAAQQAGRELPADAEAIGALYARYEDEKRRRRLVDFDDLLVRYAEALETDGRFAAAQRWRWQHVFVDELQDVNPLQCRLLLALLGENEDLFVVGDPNQAIYGWNGADPGFLADFPQRWPRAEVVRLDDNHRSSPQVVAAAAAVLGRQAGATPVRSSRPDGPLPNLRSYPSEDAEAAGIASELRQARAQGRAVGDHGRAGPDQLPTEHHLGCLEPGRRPLPGHGPHRRRRAAHRGGLAPRRRRPTPSPSPASTGPRASSGPRCGCAGSKPASCPSLMPPRPPLWPKSDDLSMWR